MAERPLVVEIDGDLGRLLLCAPPANVMDDAFFPALLDVVAQLPSLPVKGLVVMGSGRHFSSGADVESLQRRLAGPDADREGFERLAVAVESLGRLPYPTVAAVAGACLGSGLELALACNYRVAAPSAVFSLPEVEFGLIPGCGGALQLPRLVGVGRAVELILSGRTLGAEEALAVGLVDAVVPMKQLRASAEEAVRRLAAAGSPS